MRPEGVPCETRPGPGDPAIFFAGRMAGVVDPAAFHFRAARALPVNRTFRGGRAGLPALPSALETGDA